MRMRWPIAISLLAGGIVAAVSFAPARWLADWVATQSRGQVMLADSRGTVWNGSAQAVLTAGSGSRDAARLPGRTHWEWGWQSGHLVLNLRLDCCSQAAIPLRIQPSLGRMRVSLPDQPSPLITLPASWLAGLGTPWNTLQLGGRLQLSSQAFAMQQQGKGWQPEGSLQLDLIDISSRLATVSPLGSYRVLVQPSAQMPLQLSTLQGALLLSGQGSLAPRITFNGEASAAPGAEGALGNLLNIVGRREGARSLIAIG